MRLNNLTVYHDTQHNTQTLPCKSNWTDSVNGPMSPAELMAATDTLYILFAAMPCSVTLVVAEYIVV